MKSEGLLNKLQLYVIIYSSYINLLPIRRRKYICSNDIKFYLRAQPKQN